MPQVNSERLRRLFNDNSGGRETEEISLWRGPYSITLTIVSSDRGEYEVVEKSVTQNRPALLGSGVFESVMLPDVGSVIDTKEVGLDKII